MTKSDDFSNLCDAIMNQRLPKQMTKVIKVTHWPPEDATPTEEAKNLAWNFFKLCESICDAVGAIDSFTLDAGDLGGYSMLFEVAADKVDTFCTIIDSIPFASAELGATV